MADIELHITVGSDRFGAHHEGWVYQVEAFELELAETTGEVRREAEPVPGKKGDIGSLILTLGSAGVLTTAVEVFRAWIGRDRGRNLEATWTENGQLTSVKLSGATDPETFEAFTRRLLGEMDDDA